MVLHPRRLLAASELERGSESAKRQPARREHDTAAAALARRLSHRDCDGGLRLRMNPPRASESLIEASPNHDDAH
jgi:hypothetical protein